MKNPKDMRIMAYINEQTDYYPNDEAVFARTMSLGEDGLVRLMRSPLQRLDRVDGDGERRICPSRLSRAD